MGLFVHKPGLQTTIQGRRRTGFRHMGVPWSGPADSISLALANRLVGNPPETEGLEITLGGIEIEFTEDATFALTGARAPAKLGAVTCSYHETLRARQGAVLSIAPPTMGVRTYLAIAGGLDAERFLGSASTYLPARLGGHEGRILKTGDTLSLSPMPKEPPTTRTPPELKPYISRTWMIGACPSAETDLLHDPSRKDLFGGVFTVSRRGDRMGVLLEGRTLALNSDGRLPSAPVFPGTVQCPEGGAPFILMSDAQTTGGYPRIAQIIRAHRHSLGQLRPGDKVQLAEHSPQSAYDELQKKTALLKAWLEGYSL